jgi:activator of HSP90 ATPase
VKFELSPVTKGTLLDFTHTGIPEGEEASFEQGWLDNYWGPMKAFLEK